MLPEDKNQTEEELSVVICITRDLKEGTWDWMKSVKFPARYAGSLFSCVRNQKQSACKYMYFFLHQLPRVCSWCRCESPQFDLVWMTDGIIHPGEQMGSGVQADREQRDVAFVFRDLKPEMFHQDFFSNTQVDIKEHCHLFLHITTVKQKIYFRRRAVF